jgi:hypothetical protein
MKNKFQQRIINYYKIQAQNTETDKLMVLEII